MELEKLFTKKLRTVLHSKILILFLFSLVIISYFHHVEQNKTSELSSESTVFVAKLISYNQKEKKITMVLKIGKETVIGEILKNKNASFEIGTTYEMKGNLTTPQKNTIFNNFNYHSYLKNQGIHYILKIETMKLKKENNVFQKGTQILRNSISEQQNASYTKMFLLGVSDDFNPELYEIYQKNGISHLFIISGMHFTLIFEIIKKLIYIFSKKKTLIFLISLIFIFLYYALLPNSISINRAFFFLVIKELSQFFTLELSNKKIFVITLLFQLIINPFSYQFIGFQYSYAIAFGFLCFGSSKNKKWNIIRIPTIAFLFSLPISAMQNFEINMFSIFINLMMVPLLTSVILPVMFFSIFFSILSPVYSFLITILEQGNRILSEITFLTVVMPKTSFILPLMYYLFLFLLFHKQKKRFLAVLSIILLIWKMTPWFNTTCNFYFLDVGQGDASLIVTPRKKEVILIDTGPKNEYTEKSIITLLKSLGIRKIDLIVLSHGDLDHTGNALSIIEKISTKKILLNQGEYNEIEQEIVKKYPEKIITQYQSSTLKWYDLKHVLQKDENNNSRILYLCYKKYCFLYLGDANKTIEEEISSKYQLNPYVVKISHHGSKTGTSNNFLNEIKFENAIISAGRNNWYRHPNSEVLKRLESKQIKIYNTQKEGSVLFQFQQQKGTILTQVP